MNPESQAELENKEQDWLRKLSKKEPTKKKNGSIASSNGHTLCDNASSSIVTSSDRAFVRCLVVCEVFAHRFATVRRTAVEIPQITVIRTEVTDRGSLTLAARLDLTTAIRVGELENLLVGVDLSANRSCWVGGSLSADEIGLTVQHGVHTIVVRVLPSILSTCTGLDL
jgi:hypothetical protein